MTPGLDVTLAQPLNELGLLPKKKAVAGYRDNSALMVTADSQKDYTR